MAVYVGAPAAIATVYATVGAKLSAKDEASSSTNCMSLASQATSLLISIPSRVPWLMSMGAARFSTAATPVVNPAAMAILVLPSLVDCVTLVTTQLSQGVLVGANSPTTV